MRQPKFSKPPWQLMVTRPSGCGMDRRGWVLIAAGGPMAIDCTESGATFEESAANGKLIAAAPGLAFALRALVHELEQGAAQLPSGEQGIAIDKSRIQLLKDVLRSAGVD